MPEQCSGLQKKGEVPATAQFLPCRSLGLKQRILTQDLLH